MELVCADCVAQLDHCHGTLVEHPDGDVVCTEGCNDLDELRHDLRIDWSALAGRANAAVAVA